MGNTNTKLQFGNKNKHNTLTQSSSLSRSQTRTLSIPAPFPPLDQVSVHSGFSTTTHTTISNLSILSSDKVSHRTKPPKKLPPLENNVSLQRLECFTPNQTLSVFGHSSKTQIQAPISSKDLNNGVTGVYISVAIAETAYVFWGSKIHTLSADDRLELGCSIYFAMMSADKEVRKLLTKQLKKQVKVETLSLKFMDMLDWLIRNLLIDHFDLFHILRALGKSHKAFGVNISHFGPMLAAMHETFTYYFEHEYSIKEKHAIDKIFCVAAEIMIGQNLKEMNTFQEFNSSFHSLDFLKSLPICLSSRVGKEYFYRFLQLSICDEFVIFLESYDKFHSSMTDIERYLNARTMIKDCIRRESDFSINISYEIRQCTLREFGELEKLFALEPSALRVRQDMFDICYKQLMTLMQRNHWHRFVQNINSLYNSSVIAPK